MKKHCCICGDKSPRTVRGTAWLSVRADNDPTHYFCPGCQTKLESGPPEQRPILTNHCLLWRQGTIGCRISPDPNVTLHHHAKAT